MSIFTSRRARLGAVMAGVAALAASFFAATPVQAAPAAIAPSGGSVYRPVTNGEITIGAAESVRINRSGYITNGYFDTAPITGSTTFAWTSAEIPATSGITTSSESFYLSPTGSTCTTPYPSTSSTSSVTVTNTCVDWVNFSHNITLTNTTSSDITIQIDDTVADITRDGTSISGTSGVDASSGASGNRSITGNPFTASAYDSSITTYFYACLSTTSGLTAGDALTVSFEATRDGSPVTVNNGWGVSVPDGEWEINDYYNLDSDHDYTTYTVPAGFTSSTQVGLDANMSAPVAGSYSITMSVKNANGDLVAGTCSGGGGGAALTYPESVSAHSGAATTLPFSQSTKTLPAGRTSLLSASSGDDGSGGKIYAAISAGAAKVTQITPSGVNTKFAKTGSATISGVTSIGSVGVYNAKKNWFVTSGNPMSGYKIHTGSMTSSSSVTTKNISSTSLTTACGGTGYSSMGFMAVSAALASPVISVMCTKTSNMVSFTVLAKVTPTSGAVTKLLKVGDPTAVQCLNDSFGYNLGATGAVNAIVVYLASATSSDNCMTMTYTKREIWTITAAGTVTNKAISGNPWGSSAADEPSYLFFAPGKSAGSWIGTGYIAAPMSPPSGIRLFTVSSAKALSAKGTVAYDQASLENYMYPSFYPVKEISSSKWSLRMTEQPTAGSMNTALTTVNPTSGAVTVGEVLSVEGYASYNYRQIINSTAWSSDGKLYHYVLSDPTHVVISKWTSPTS